MKKWLRGDWNRRNKEPEKNDQICMKNILQSIRRSQNGKNGKESGKACQMKSNVIKSECCEKKDGPLLRKVLRTSEYNRHIEKESRRNQ